VHNEQTKGWFYNDDKFLAFSKILMYNRPKLCRPTQVSELTHWLILVIYIVAFLSTPISDISEPF